MLYESLIEGNVSQENLKINIPDDDDDSSSSSTEDEDTSLSCSCRVIGYLTCTILGYFCSYLSTNFIGGNPYTFTILYTIGNIISLIGSLIVYGNPFNDFLIMFSRKHILPTLLYFIAIGLSFYCAFTKHSKLIYVFISFQVVANIWSSYTYLPDRLKKSICSNFW